MLQIGSVVYLDTLSLRRVCGASGIKGSSLPTFFRLEGSASCLCTCQASCIGLPTNPFLSPFSLLNCIRQKEDGLAILAAR